VPFVMDVMGTNARHVDGAVLSAVASVGVGTTGKEVVDLLEGEWHETAMGAWYSLFHDPHDVGSELEAALRRSKGFLSAPALTVALVVQLRHKAIPVLRDYLQRDPDEELGAWGFVRAAAQHLGAVMSHRPPTEAEQTEFNELLATALQLCGSSETVG
jgi:hypothetical protein